MKSVKKKWVILFLQQIYDVISGTAVGLVRGGGLRFP